MEDRIFIEQLRVRGIHGVHAHERNEPQDFSVDLSIVFDTSKAGATDALEDSFDYGHLRDVVHQVFAGKSCNLIERLAVVIACAILADKRIAEIVVTIRKMGAYDDCVPGVSITRRQPFVL